MHAWARGLDRRAGTRATAAIRRRSANWARRTGPRRLWRRWPAQYRARRLILAWPRPRRASLFRSTCRIQSLAQYLAHPLGKLIECLFALLATHSERLFRQHRRLVCGRGPLAHCCLVALEHLAELGAKYGLLALRILKLLQIRLVLLQERRAHLAELLVHLRHMLSAAHGRHCLSLLGGTYLARSA